jgi:uncharacterized protein YuzE
MAEIEVHYDKGTQTLTVWFGDPNEEVDCDHTDSDVIVMLNDKGKPLGIEVLGYVPEDGPLRVSIDEVNTSIPAISASA